MRRRVLANAKNAVVLVPSSPFKAEGRRQETMPSAAAANHCAERGKPATLGIISGAACR